MFIELEARRTLPTAARAAAREATAAKTTRETAAKSAAA